MPLRYARSREDTEKFVKMFHMAIMRQMAKHVASPVTWENSRAFIEAMDMATIRVKVAERLDAESAVEVAYGAESLPQKLKGQKRVVVVARKQSKTIQDAPEKERLAIKDVDVQTARTKKKAKTEASSGAKSSGGVMVKREPEAYPPAKVDKVCWVTAAHGSARMHFSNVSNSKPVVNEQCATLCKHNKGTGGHRTVACAETGAIEVAGEQGRWLCVACLKLLPLPCVESMVRRCPEYLLMQIRQYRPEACEKEPGVGS
jgi:hypothetical protein